MKIEAAGHDWMLEIVSWVTRDCRETGARWTGESRELREVRSRDW